MKTTNIKARILPVLNQIIAYLHNKSRISEKSAAKKLHFSTANEEKSAKF